MDTSKIKKRLIELDKEIHDILRMIEGEGEKKIDIAASSQGAWGYDVDSVDFVRELRKSKRMNRET
ncbi:MAG: hypothetical protein R6U61_04030 [Thermoplasmata archaeon]